MALLKWFIVHRGKEIGPYSTLDLRQMADSGKLGPNALIRREDKNVPSKAGSIKGLFREPVATRAEPIPVTTSFTPSIEPISRPDQPGDRLNRIYRSVLSIARWCLEQLRAGWKWLKPVLLQFMRWLWKTTVQLARRATPFARRLASKAKDKWARLSPRGKVAVGAAILMTLALCCYGFVSLLSVGEMRGAATRFEDDTPSNQEMVALLVKGSVALASQDNFGVNVGPIEFNELMRSMARELGAANFDHSRHLLNISPTHQKEVTVNDNHVLKVWYESSNWVGFIRNKNTGRWQLFMAEFGDERWDFVTGLNHK